MLTGCPGSDIPGPDPSERSARIELGAEKVLAGTESINVAVVPKVGLLSWVEPRPWANTAVGEQLLSPERYEYDESAEISDAVGGTEAETVIDCPKSKTLDVLVAYSGYSYPDTGRPARDVSLCSSCNIIPSCNRKFCCR